MSKSKKARLSGLPRLKKNELIEKVAQDNVPVLAISITYEAINRVTMNTPPSIRGILKDKRVIFQAVRPEGADDLQAIDIALESACVKFRDEMNAIQEEKRAILEEIFR